MPELNSAQNKNLKNQTISGLIWKFAERCGAQIVTFIVSIILARLLDPKVYGTIALITVITTILQVFVDSGLGNALIQKKDVDDTDFSTVFYFNLVMCGGLYALLFVTAPLIAKFYEMPELTDVIRVLGLTLIVSGLKNVQQAYVSKYMLFKKFFFSTLGGTIGAAVVGIAMAVLGFGIWALVGQYLFNLVVDTFILWLTVKWRPKKLFSWERLKGLFSYGWKLLLSALIDTIYNDIRSLIIGKKYSEEDLAFYNRGKQFPNLIVANINSSIDSVLLPTLSEKQNDREAVKAMTRRAIKTSSFIMWPLMVGLAVCAEPLVRLVLTEKWLFSVPYLRVFCFTYAFYPIHTANLNAIKAMGRSDLFLTLEIIKKTIGMAILLTAMWFGVKVIAYSLLLSALISSFVNSFPNKKLLGYNYLEQIGDILPSVLLSAVMGAIVACVHFIGLADIFTLAIQVTVGATVYIFGAKLCKLESFEYVVNLLKKFIKKEKKAEEKPMKKIMLLGGSAQQVVAIETAKRLGYYTVLCDYLDDNPGQFAADKFYLVSTTDKEAVLEVAKKEKIDGILAYASDPAAPTAAYVAEKLGLPGNPYESVQILCEKDKFRRFLSENGFNCPRAKGYEQISEAVKDLTNGYFHLPVIVKPVDSSGSKGATVLYDLEKSEEYCKNAFSFSRNGRIIVEEFIEKKHPYLIGGDIFIWNGKVVLWGLLNCHRDNKVNSLVPVGKSYPLEIGDEDFNNVKSALQGIVDKLGIRFGAMNVEAVIDRNDNVYPIDIGPRSGGNMIPDLLGLIFGVNIIEAIVKTAMGQELTNFTDLEAPLNTFYASYNLHSSENGILDRIEFSSEIESHIVRKNIYVKSGDRVEYFENASKALGVLFLSFSDLSEMKSFLSEMENNVRIILKEGV